MDKSTKIKITIGEVVSYAELDDSQASRDIVECLPQTIAMVKWGDREYYGPIKGRISEQGQAEHNCENGDICYWSAGRSFAFFYDTSRDKYMPSPVRMIGRLTSDLKVFTDMPAYIKARVELSD